MTLLALPTELLEQIIVWTIPESFEQIALVCKGTYNISVPYIAHYQKCRSLRNLSYKTSGPFYTDLQLLSMFISDPSLGRYVQTASLTLGGTYEEHDFSREFWRTAPRFGDGKTVPAIRRFLTQTTHFDNDFRTRILEALESYCGHPYIDEDLDGNGSTLEQGAEYWDDEGIGFQLRAHQMGALPTLVMLALMPNLEQLHVPLEWDFLDGFHRGEEHEVLWPAVDSFVRATNAGAFASRPRGLKTVLSSPCRDDEYPPSISALLPFIALQSVERLSASEYSGDDPFEWRYPSSSWYFGRRAPKITI